VGFKHKKCDDGRKFLMELSDIVAARAAFLIKVYKMGFADRACIYYKGQPKPNKKELAEHEQWFR
jgi:hypothetical protein